MHPPSRFTLVLLGLVTCATVVPGQQEAPPTVPGPHKILLDVVVAPKSGTPVAGLQEKDFTILDNNVARPITSFSALGGQPAPVEVILVVDAVNANFQNIAYERNQIETYLKADGGHLAHPTTLAIFTDTGTQIQQGFSSDGNAISTALDQDAIGLRNIRRSSVDGADDRFQLSMTALQLLATKEAAYPGRKIILWVSPGWPLLSRSDADLGAKQIQQIYAQIVVMSTLLRRGGITLYSIDPLGAGENIDRSSHYEEFLKGVSKPQQVELGDLGLQVLAVQTGGLALGPSNDIARLLERCIADTTAYYELSFDAPPAERRDEYHALQLKVSSPDLTAHTRTGYYAEP